MLVMYFVHCESHGAVHHIEEGGKCWCGCVEDSETKEHGWSTTVLEADTKEGAFEECRERGLWIYGDTVK